MDNVDNDNKKLVVIIVVIITVLLSTTYAFLTLDSNNGSTSGKACSDVSYSATDITTSALVSTDVEPDIDNDVADDGDNPLSVITVAQTCEIYKSVGIYIHTNSDGTSAPINGERQALKYKLVSSNKVVASGVINVIGDLLIATVPLEEPTVYYLYIWVDSTISSGAYNGKNYSGYIYAETDPVSSTITSNNNE